MKAFVGALMLSVSTAAFAQVAPAPVVPAVTPVDPAAVAAARPIAARMLPAGTYKTVMGSAMDGVMGNLGDAMKSLPLRQLAEMGGLDSKQAAALDKIDIAAVMAIYDPHWQERTQLQMKAMFAAMGEFFTTFEPDLREAMAKAYARHYSIDELHDLDRYLSTPTGAKFAANSMTIMVDPAVMETTRAMMPKMMQQLPQFIAAAEKATASLPPPRKVEDLSEQEKEKIAKALGIDPAKLRDPKTST
jgi:hypothetical protein